MKVSSSLAAICTLPMFAFSLHAQSTGSAFYGDAPDANHPWAVHDRNRPQPVVVTPGTSSSQEQPGKAPSDAVILFDGTESSLSKWSSDKNPAEATKWVVKEGALQCVPGSGYVRTKEEFGDCQLHVEWAEPADITGESQGRGNSGVFLMGMTEVQVLDSYKNPTYADGSAGSVYGVNPPMANPLRPPGEWQSYDIVFRRPVYKDGKEIEAGTVTVFVNGVLVQDHTPLEGGGGHKSRSKPRPFPEKGPLKLQDHGNPVKYRNIWYRPLPPRATEGGTNGYLSEEAAMAKRKEIAENIRGDAAKLEGNARLLRLLESLCYVSDEGAWTQSEELLTQYTASLKQVPADKIESKKGEVLQFHNALTYLAKYKIIPDTLAAKVEIAKMVKENEWDKKK